MLKNSLFFSLFFISFFLSAQNPSEHYTQIADSLDFKRNFQESLQYRQKAIEVLGKESDSDNKRLEALYSYTSAELDFSVPKKDYSEDFNALKQAIEAMEKAGVSSERLSYAYFSLSGHSFDFLYNPEDSEVFLNQAFDYFEQSKEKDTLHLITMKEFSSYSKIMARQYEVAIDEAKKGLKILENYGTSSEDVKELTAKLYYNLGLVHNVNFLNIPLKEYQYNLEAEKVLSSMENPNMEQLVLTYRALAIFARENKNFENGINFMNKAFRLYGENKEIIHKQAGFKLELALHRIYVLLLIESGRQEKLKENIATVESLYKNNEFDDLEKANYIGYLNFISHYFLANNQPDSAYVYIDKARKVQIDPSKSPYSIDSFLQQTDLNLIQLLIHEKKYDEALARVESTINVYGDRLRTNVNPIKTIIYLGLNDYESAKASIDKYLSSLSPQNNNFNFPNGSISDFDPGHAISRAETFIFLAEAFRNYYGEISREEEQLYWMALLLFENNLEDVSLNKELKIFYDKIISGLMEIAIQRDFSEEESNRLLGFMETVTSKELINKFMLKREIAQNTESYKLIEEEQYIRSYITYLKKKIQEFDDEEVKKEIFEKERELDEIYRQIKNQYGRNNPFIKPEIDVRQAPKNRNIIKFKVANDKLYRISLEKGNLSYAAIPSYPELKQEIESFLQNLTSLKVSSETLKKQGASLYQKLFDRAPDSDVPTTIIPDDILYFLPFDLLVNQGKYLIEDHVISYDSNMYFLFHQSENSSKRKKKDYAVYFAPEYTGEATESQIAVRGASYSLEGAKNEVRVISSMIPGKTYLGKDASKSNFRDLEDGYSILHLAMHSNLDDRDSELSHLVFSNSETDYEMYISEIYGMNFDADLAVLSACNTGIGGFKNGENLISLHHTFTTAGIPATVASLWNAPDQSTRDIMVKFYKNLKENQDKATALRNAKLEYLQKIKNKELQHPFFWAGFVLSGDDSPMNLPPDSFWTSSIFIFIGAGIALLLLIYFVVRARKSKVEKI